MPAPRALFTFGEDGMAVESGLGAARLEWSAFQEVWERSGYWMLFIGPAQFMTLPLGDLAPAELQWLRERLRAAR
nr:YcxB family protein [Lysobacter enzymogenes]